jgi:ribonuclease T1
MRSRPLLFLIICLALLIGCVPTAAPTPSSRTARPAQATAATARLDCARTLRGGAHPNVPKLAAAELYRCRPEAKAIVAIINRNGPFEFDRDDITFQNREVYLPPAQQGTYREYTVLTPGESTRGARRLITSGERNRRPTNYKSLYYTDDHYDTMWLVVEP